MGIEDLKRWHWIVIGIVVGCALGYVWNGVEPAPTRRGSADDLLRNITRKDPQTNSPIIRRVVVNPPQQAANGMANVVNYTKLMFDSKKKKNVVASYWFVAEIPFVPPMGAQGTQVDPTMTISRYLDELKRRDNSISYWSGWWTTRPAVMGIWIIGSVIVIGGLWPNVINGLIGAGYGRPRREKKAFSLWKYKSAPAAATAPAKPAVTAADQQRLEQMTEKLEHDLAVAGLGMTQASSDQPVAAASGVRKLEGGPLEVAPIANPDADDEIEIKGEYYPVLIHHKKHHEEPASDADHEKH